MLTHQSIGVTRVTVRQLGLKKDALPDVITYVDREYAFWYYLLERGANFDGAVYRSEPDALLFVSVKEPA